MKITKHVDFDSLLSKTASREDIIEALKIDDELKDQQNDKTAETKSEKAMADTAQVGALGAGAVAYAGHARAKKQLGKLGKKLKKAKDAEAYASRPLGQKVKDYFSDMIKGPKKKKPLSEKIMKKMNKVNARGKKGALVAMGAAGTTAAIGAYRSYKGNKDSQGKLDKTAASEEVRGQIANDVERDSTPEGGAKYRGTQGAIVGGLAGFMHGVSKKSPIKGKKAKIVRGLWHGTSGAVWAGGAAGATTYAKKKLMPDSAEDKQKEFESRLEKRASVPIAVKTTQKGKGLVAAISGLFKKKTKPTLNQGRIAKSPQQRKLEAQAASKKRSVKKINYGEAYSMDNNYKDLQKMRGIQSRWS